MRARWARDEAEALDATQDFFVGLLGGDLLDRADPSRGRFRAYVRAALANFLADQDRRRAARKRGGGVRFVPLDDPLALELPDTLGMEPEVARRAEQRTSDWEREARNMSRLEER